MRIAPMVSTLLAVVVTAAGVLTAGAATASAATAFMPIGSFSGPGSGPGELGNPQRSAIRTSTGELFVADRDNDRVQVFDTATNTVIGQFGDGAVTDDPFGVAVDQVTGDVYVSSSGSNTITKWSDGGLGYTQEVLFVSPGQGSDAGQVGSFASPLAIAPSSGDLLVADTANQRIARFDSAGLAVGVEFNGEDATAPESPAFSQLKDIAVDQADGVVYVADGGRVARYASDYEYQATLDPVSGPAVVAVDPASGDPVVTVNSDSCETTRVVAYAGTAIESTSKVPPAADDCTAATGIAFTSTGSLYAVNGGAFGGCCGGQTSIQVLERTAPLSYSATANPATNITETTARLRGALDPAANEVTYTFEYTSDGANWVQAGEQGPFGDSTQVPVQANVAGLTDGTTYRFRIAIRALASPGITAYSNGEAFTTVDGDPPAVSLSPATDVTSSGFTLHGEIDPNGLMTTYRFEASGDGGSNWTALAGPDGDPGVDDVAGAGNVSDPVAAETTGLDPNRGYLYRLLATNIVGQGQADAAEATTTSGEQATVDDASLTASQLTATTVRLSATLNSRNTDTGWHIEYGTDSGYGSSTAAATLPVPAFDPSLDNPFDPDTRTSAVAKTLTGLQPATTYHYRLVADNGNGPAAVSGDHVFTTLPPPPTATTGDVGDITTDTVTVAGTVDTHGLGGTASFSVVQTDGGHSQTVGPIDLAPADGPRQVAATATGLPPGGSYTARLSVTTTGGESFGDLVAFTTQTQPRYQPPAPPPAHSDDWFGPPPTAPAAPSNVFTARPTIRGTLATIAIAVPGPGTLRASGRRVASVVERSTGKGTVTLRIRLTKAGRKALRDSNSGRLSVRATLRFTPSGGTPRTVTRTLTFKRKAGR